MWAPSLGLAAVRWLPCWRWVVTSRWRFRRSLLSGCRPSGDVGAVELANTILVRQTVGITVTAGNTATLKATFWHGNGTRRAGPGTVIHGQDHSGDPSFVNAGAGDFHIRADSEARDKGINVFVYADIDGQLWPEGGGYDIGADEYYLPVMLRIH